VRGRRVFVNGAILVFFLGVMLVGLVPYRQIINQRAAVSDAETRLEQLRAENAELREGIDALGTEVEIERRAREDFGLVRPGETAYIVIPAAEAPPVNAEPVAHESRSFLESVLDFLTGRDTEG
jgi:cell division protein FtsB